MTYIKATNKRLKRHFPSSILVGLRDFGGQKRAAKLWVSVPHEWLKKAFNTIPGRVNFFWDDKETHKFCIEETLKGGHKIRKTSKNLYTFWCNMHQDLNYFNDIDCGESDIISILDRNICFEIQKRLKNDR